MEGTAVIRGKVVDKYGKRPSGEVHLHLQPPGEEQIGKWGYSGRLSEDGTFEITGVPPDEYRITAKPNPSPGKYQADERTMKIEVGRTYTLDIVLNPRK